MISLKKRKGNRAFTKTGLKVVFHFLLDSELINQQQRKIAAVTNVALGNIPQVIDGLLETNFILKRDKQKYIIKNYETLLDKWIAEYAQTLKPALLKQRFRFHDSSRNWQEVPFSLHKTVWGGEPAGDIVTGYLRPEKLTLYTVETIKNLMINYKLIPDDGGDIWVYEMFWNDTFNNKTVPLPLIYPI